MKSKKIISVAVVCGAMLIGIQSANAKPGFDTRLNAALGSSVSCNACHKGTNTESTAILPIAITWKMNSSPASLADSDSDGDGFTNKQEADRSSLDFNEITRTPFTLVKALENSTSTKVVVTGGIATETTIATDPYAETGITLTGTNEIAGLVAAQVTTASATLTFAKPIVAGSKAYAVNLATKTNTALTNITYNPNGSVTIAGITPTTDIVVERVLTNYNIAPGAGQGGGGCIAGAATTPILMLLSMLTLGLFVRRKKG